MLYVKRIIYSEFNIKLFDFEPQLNFLKIYIKVSFLSIVADPWDSQLADTASVLLF